MHTILLLVVTSGLVLLQTTQGLAANVELDTDFIEEAMADGFIVGTKEPYKAENTQDKNNGITHDSSNPEANLSHFLKDSVPTETTAKNPEAIIELTSKNNKELPKNESAPVLITVGSKQATNFSPDENDEGSGMFPKWVLEKTSVNGLSKNMDGSGGSGMFPEFLDETQEKALEFTTTVSTNLITSTLSSEEISGSAMEPEASTTDSMTTMPAFIGDENIIPRHINRILKPMEASDPEPEIEVSSQPKPLLLEETAHEPKAQVKDGTSGWKLILGLCLTVGALICVFVGIGTKDMWYGPDKRCFNINSSESKKQEGYKAGTHSLSEKEEVALMASQKAERNKTDSTIITLEETPEKEYLM